ncbi:MAG: MerR family transcriptional regulator [Coriobacteriales bacterium]
MQDEEKGKLFTTGEIADRCNVSVRTVQYYDEKGLMHPTERSDGGRRLYDETSLERMRIICLLKALGLSLKAIRGILENPEDNAALLCLLEEQEKATVAELEGNRDTLKSIRTAIEGIRETGSLPEDIDTSMDPIMEEKSSRLHRTKRRMIIEGIIVDVIEIGTLVYGIVTGQWLPFACSMILIVIICVEMVRDYYQDSRYICPRCHAVFQPTWKSFSLSGHTPKTRKLTCPKCGEKSWCAEVSADRVGDAEGATAQF